MAADTRDGAEFGQVSRIRGIVFEYLTLAASVVGILALGILMAYVFWDAFGLTNAGTGWYLTYAATLAAPIIGFLAYTRRNPAAGEAALELVNAVVGGVVLGLALVVVLLVVTSASVWFAYFVTTVAPAVALAVYARYDETANWASLGAIAATLLGPVVGTLALGPLSSIALLFGGPGVMFVSIVIPAALVLWYVLAVRLEVNNRLAIAAAIALPAVGIAGVPLYIDGVESVGRSAWLVMLSAVGVPVIAAVTNTLQTVERRPGFVLPAILVVGFLLGEQVVDILGLSEPTPWLDWQYLTSLPDSQVAEVAGIYPALIGSIFMISLVAIFTFVLGVGAAVYLEEYAPQKGKWGRVIGIIRVNISNLAGVPSVVYGLLGLGIFMNFNAGVTLPVVGRVAYSGTGTGTVLTAALTLSLLILPIVIISAQEAIRSVPDSLRRGSYGMGATKWQTVRNVVLPEALPGILTGTILALGRAVGETAPLIMVGVAATSYSPPAGLFDQFSALPRLLYSWAFLPGEAYRHGVLAAGVVTLLVVLLTMNSVAILVRNKYEREQ